MPSLREQNVTVGLGAGMLIDAAVSQRTILGVRIADLSREEATRSILRAINDQRHLKVGFCNAHTANSAQDDARFLSALGGFLVLPDGIGVDVAARVLYGSAFQANLNGTDFIPHVLQASERPLRIALVGGQPGIAERAAERLAALGPGHTITACLDGFGDEGTQQAWLARLAEAPVDVLLVAMGNPKQEFWIAEHVTDRHASVAIGVGALFDFLAGHVVRAPRLVRRARLEWVWRLLREPRRLFRRYVLGNPLFLMRVAAAKLGRHTA
jgi:exopolysaccharide biosynthesis WecB/TagA/CpsF family protein